MMPTNRISGVKIAAGRATWVTGEDGKGYYNFINSNSFKWFANPDQLIAMGIDQQDLLDCVEQAEKQFGAPEEYRPALGLYPDAGYTNIGATYRSKENEKIIAVFTPTSVHGPCEAPTDAYFEWYMQEVPEQNADENLPDFLSYFDAVTGNRVGEYVDTSPVVPGYDEAVETTRGNMAEDMRERFLQQVWNFHKNVSPGFKQKLGEDILETWSRVKRVSKVLAAYTPEQRQVLLKKKA